MLYHYITSRDTSRGCVCGAILADADDFEDLAADIEAMHLCFGAQEAADFVVRSFEGVTTVSADKKQTIMWLMWVMAQHVGVTAFDTGDEAAIG